MIAARPGRALASAGQSMTAKRVGRREAEVALRSSVAPQAVYPAFEQDAGREGGVEDDVGGDDARQVRLADPAPQPAGAAPDDDDEAEGDDMMPGVTMADMRNSATSSILQTRKTQTVRGQANSKCRWRASSVESAACRVVIPRRYAEIVERMADPACVAATWRWRRI